MATDATGVPTTLGIPKFLTSADAPSGNGGNAQMDSIDALIQARVNRPAGVAAGDVPVWNGATFVVPTGVRDGTKFLRDDGSYQSTTTALQKISFVGMPVSISASTGSTWPTANAAILVPFTIQTPQTIDRIHFKVGPTTSGNFDVGIYDVSGTRKVSKGSTAMSGLSTGVVNEVTFTSTPLVAGQYYLALAVDNTTATINAGSGDILTKYQRQVATSFPLPSTIVPGSTVPTAMLLLSAPAT